MKILLVNYRYFISGGPEKYMFNIKKSLEEHGHTVIPFSNYSDKNVKTEYSKYFVEPVGGRNATYYEDYQKTPKNIIKMITRSIYSREVEKAIRKEIRAEKPDLVYIIHFVNKLSPSVILGAKKEGLPVVLRLSDYFLLCPRFDFLYHKKICEDCLTKGYISCIKKRCVKNSLLVSIIRVTAMKVHNWAHIYNYVDAFISPSEFLKEKMIQNGFKRSDIYCIPTFTNSQSKAEPTSVGSYGLYFGRITEEKSISTIIKAYEKLPNYHVKIVGDDSTKEAVQLKQYVLSHKLENIKFLGFKTGKELAKIIINSRFTIISSICYENLPNSVLESFQYFKPVIASNIGSLPELVFDGENGFLFEPTNVDELCEKIQKMDDEDLVIKMGRAGKEKLRTKFSPETHYNSLMHVFEKCISNNP